MIRILLLCTATALLVGCAASAARPPADVDMQRFMRDVERLSSDAFGGRAPASAGERLTVDYLVSAFREAGLVGGNDGSFLQEVPLVAITATDVAPLTFGDASGAVALKMGEEAIVWTKRLTERVAVDDSEVVFVGYGIVAPEYDWNDYAGVDVRGKTVVMLVNDPGFASGDDALFTGRRMTYYGRWTYKFEEAARQGASGAILVHETEAAGYPWAVVSGGWSGPQFDLETADGNASRAAFEGWISDAAATRLFARFGHDYSALRDRAGAPGFEAVAIDALASTAISNTLERSVSNNVVAVLPGDVPGESVGYSAHWDHLGTTVIDDGDGIYNGAVDNATGTAALLEIARVLASEPRRRSYVFLAVTAEESGLLGSAWFARNPTVPLATMAALINIDSMVVIGETRDVAVVGYGSSELEDYLAAAAAEQGRRLEPESSPEKGFFYRSDHFNFAKQGVPVLYAESGIDHVEFGADYGAARAAEYISEHYHKPSDEVRDNWDLSSAEQDLRLYISVGRMLANTAAWPEWFAGNEFRSKRDESTDARR